MNSKLGEFLKEKRLEKGVSLRDFSKQLNISHAYLAKLEIGIDPRSGKDVIPTLETLDKIASGLNIPQKTLFQLAKQDLYTEDETEINLTQNFSNFIFDLKDKKSLYLNGRILDEKECTLIYESLQKTFDSVVETILKK